MFESQKDDIWRGRNIILVPEYLAYNIFDKRGRMYNKDETGL